jgi:fibro-slime domain-containing protein
MRLAHVVPVSLIALGALTTFACSSSNPDGEFPPTTQTGDPPPSSSLLSGEGGTLPGDDEGTTNGPVCGNGFVDVGETCDDGNTAGGDGCGTACTIEPGYKCAVPGAACAASACGDGIVAGTEDCDDGNTADSDGCSKLCTFEDGFACPTPGKACVATHCGDGKTEGTEQCDDGANQAFDGCSPTCEVEPVCSGGTCAAVCGDGLKFPGEECDDGNKRDGDGCSASCKLESGFTCNVVVTAPPGALTLPVVYRDFLPNGYAGTIPAGYAAHPDFEQYNPGLCAGLIQPTLDAENKPVLKNSKACDSTKTWMTSADSFKQWYRDGLKNASNLLVNKRIDDTLTLKKQADGSYVFDSNDAPYSEGKFFPLETRGFAVETGMKDADQVAHNFHFTSEFKYWFTFTAGTNPTLEFRGDDDVWVFINNKLAVDLGGVHGAESGSITLDAAHATTLGLTDGGMYEITVFQAERHTTASNYKLTLRGFERARTECASVCGDGVKTRTEACDDGAANNTGGYGKCSADCTLGPRCGDGVVQAAQGEDCDDGNLVNGDTCSSTCKTTSSGPN